MKIIKLILISTIFISNMYAEDINNILSNVIKTYGGEKNLQKLSSYKQEWNIVNLTNNEKGIDSRVVTFPNSLSTTLTYKSNVEKRVVTPAGAYKVINGQKELVDGVKAKAMNLQLKRLYTPLMLKEKSSELKLADYQTHYALISNVNHEEVVYFVDKKTFAITQVTAIVYVEEQAIIFNTLYTVFKKFDDVLIPTKEYKSVNNIQTAILRLKSIDFIAN